MYKKLDNIKKKNEYIKPILELAYFSSSDIITSSVPCTDDQGCPTNFPENENGVVQNSFIK